MPAVLLARCWAEAEARQMATAVSLGSASSSPRALPGSSRRSVSNESPLSPRTSSHSLSPSRTLRRTTAFASRPSTTSPCTAICTACLRACIFGGSCRKRYASMSVPSSSCCFCRFASRPRAT
eukprot:3938434-Rhodomonas_salina.1